MRALLILALALPAFAQTTALRLAWTWTQGTGTPADGFNIYRSTVQGACLATPRPATCQLLAQVMPATVLTYTDAPSATNVLTPGTVYYYVVTAYSLAAAPQGESAPSAEGSARFPVPPAPNAPGAPTVTVVVIPSN